MITSIEAQIKIQKNPSQARKNLVNNLRILEKDGNFLKIYPYIVSLRVMLDENNTVRNGMDDRNAIGIQIEKGQV